MSEFFNGGISTENLTLFLVSISLIVAIVLPLWIHHLQKPRPKIKIRNGGCGGHGVEFVAVRVYLRNIGYQIAEGVKVEMKSETKGVNVVLQNPSARDLEPRADFIASANVYMNQWEKCEIEIKILWENHTSLLKKYDEQSQKFIFTWIEKNHVEFNFQ